MVVKGRGEEDQRREIISLQAREMRAAALEKSLGQRDDTTVASVVFVKNRRRRNRIVH